MRSVPNDLTANGPLDLFIQYPHTSISFDWTIRILIDIFFCREHCTGPISPQDVENVIVISILTFRPQNYWIVRKSWSEEEDEADELQGELYEDHLAKSDSFFEMEDILHSDPTTRTRIEDLNMATNILQISICTIQ